MRRSVSALVLASLLASACAPGPSSSPIAAAAAPPSPAASPPAAAASAVPRRPTAPPSPAGSPAAAASAVEPRPVAVRTSQPSEPPRPSPVARALDQVVTLVGAGDIASCGSDGDEATAALIERIPGTVFTLGDTAYDRGTSAEFRCYEASWGRFRDRTRPSLGNHDYGAGHASAYFAYFGALAGESPRGYYSYDLGSWHVVVLNSNCWAVGGCGDGSAQERWLRDDLASSGARCTVAYWHHARFSSGAHGSDTNVAPLFRALYEGGADLVLVGHDHHYERFAPQDPDGRADPRRGIRQFVVGTGGRSIYAVGPRIANSEAVRQTFGVLALTLGSGGYSWKFVPVGTGETDTGSGDCH